MPTLLSHALPYVLFVAIGAVAAVLPTNLAPWADPAAAAAGGIALLVFWRRGAYGELRPRPSPVRHAGWWAVGAGLLAGLLWVPLTPDWLLTLGERSGFNPLAAGQQAEVWLWGGRLLGTLAVVPFAEELLVRSLLPRYVDTSVTGGAWQERPLGAFTPTSFAVSVGFFTVTHPEWLAAMVAGVLWTWLLMKTGRISDVVRAHLVANAVLAAWVIGSGDPTWW